MRRTHQPRREYSVEEDFGVGGVQSTATWTVAWTDDGQYTTLTLEFEDTSQVVDFPISMSDVPYHVLDEIEEAIDEDRREIQDEIKA